MDMLEDFKNLMKLIGFYAFCALLIALSVRGLTSHVDIEYQRTCAQDKYHDYTSFKDKIYLICLDPQNQPYIKEYKKD